MSSRRRLLVAAPLALVVAVALTACPNQQVVRGARTPVWSPDGAEIAFADDLGGQYDVYVMNADGSDQRRITTGPRNDSAPSWSSDVSKIAYTSGDNSTTRIYVMNADGSDQDVVGDDAGSNFTPDWSPDGQLLVFVTLRDGVDQMYVMPADGQGPERRLSSP